MTKNDGQTNVKVPSEISYIEALSRLALSGAPFVSVTMVQSTGSTPQDAGSKMLVTGADRAYGTVGGGKVEHAAIQFAAEMIQDASRDREIVDWNLQRDIGMTCGGWVKLYFEVYNRNDWHILVFGAGHVAQSLIRVLLTLDCRITCVDSRSDWIDRIPDDRRLTKICTDDLAGFADQVTENDYVVCMTMGHATDRPVLSRIFQRGVQPVYLGVIGSKSKRGALIREIKADGIDSEVAGRFHCPLGLPIGSNQPAEIAISIAAQLIQVRDQIKIGS